MAERLGSPTALVLTGTSSAEDARAAKRPPTTVLPDITSFPDLLEAA
jgi:ribonucleotide monophosphatase NagD (HAD superfamily)